MRRSFRGKKQRSKPTKEFRANEKILARELMIIGESGEGLGLMTKEKALEEAKNKGLDLVEVSPKAQPPIAKFMDYGSFKYQREKMEKKAKAKQKSSETKTVKVSNRISQHDLDVRVDRAIKFLDNNDKVKIELQLRGREHQHVDLAKENVQKVITEIRSKLEEGKELKSEQEIKKVGSRLSTIVSIK